MTHASRSVLVSFALLIHAGTALAHPPWYTVQVVGPVPGHAGVMYPKSINDHGQVVGLVGHVSGHAKGFIWLPSPAYGYPAGPTLLNNLGGADGDATGINNAGQVSGSTYSITGQVDIARWNLATSTVPEILFNTGYTQCINSLGVIGGNGIQPSFSCNVASVFATAASNAMISSTECANSRVHSLNTAGMAVGVGYVTSNKGFIAMPPLYAAVELPNFAGVVGPSFYTQANTVNDVGQVAGQVHHPTLGSVAIRFQDLNANGIPEPATEYTILSTAASGSCTGLGINGQGHVSGVRAGNDGAMLWKDGQEYQLNNHVFKGPNGLPFLRGAVDINESGQILCKATTASGELAVVLTPMCYANCDGAGGLTPNDFMCFLNAYISGSPYANCDDSAGVPLLTGNDFVCFLAEFASGCP
jgi:hypothetical protein